MTAVKKEIIKAGPQSKNKAANKIMAEAVKLNIDVVTLFEQADLDHNGKLDIKEIEKTFTTLRLADRLSIRKIFDINKDGGIDLEEFKLILSGKVPDSPSKKAKVEDEGGDMFADDEEAGAAGD